MRNTKEQFRIRINYVSYTSLCLPTCGTEQELERLHKLVQNTCWKKRRRYVMDKFVRRGEGFEHVCEN